MGQRWSWSAAGISMEEECLSSSLGISKCQLVLYIVLLATDTFTAKAVEICSNRCKRAKAGVVSANVYLP